MYDCYMMYTNASEPFTASGKLRSYLFSSVNGLIDSNAIVVYEFVVIASLLMLVLGGERSATMVLLQKKLACLRPAFFALSCRSLT